MMPEKQCNLADGRQTRLTQIQKHLEELSPDELQTEFESFFLNATDEPLDLELLDLYLKRLDKISPMELELTAEESLKGFRDKHAFLLESLESENTPTKRRKSIRFVVLVAVAAVLMGLMIVQVSGIDWIGSFARWTSETFGFSTRSYEIVTQWNPEYDGLRAALVEQGITENLIPKYLPEGYQETELLVEPTGKYIVAGYASDEKYIMISIDSKHGTDGIIVEKNSTNPEIYMVGNIEHYVMTNVDSNLYVAVWKNGDFDCAIYGVPTKDTLIQMIDSIYTEVINEK